MDVPAPLPLTAAGLGGVEAILTDFDGTLTTGDVLRTRTLDALWRLREGDSLNDAPMFGAFALSIGVANVRPLLGELDAPPRFITRAEEGRGFEEVARAVLRARRPPRRES